MVKQLKVPFIGTIGTLGAFCWHSIDYEHAARIPQPIRFVFLRLG
jgi:hypothetical protein